MEDHGRRLRHLLRPSLSEGTEFLPVSRFKPDFGLTFVPWFSWLPLSDFDIFLMDIDEHDGVVLLRSFDDWQIL
jgi:hypothetical protein